VPAFFTVANGGRDGIGLMRRSKALSIPAIIFTYMVTYYTWHRVVGYSKDVALEQTYAKNHKMLRNMLIKQ
jgi:hypothetical protein